MTAVDNKASSSVILKQLIDLFPEENISDLWKKTFEIINTSKAKEYEEKLTKFGDQLDQNLSIQKRLAEMRNAGYSFEQTFLYLEAPDQSPLHTQTTKQDYLKIWRADKNFKPKIKSIDVIDRGKFAAGAIASLVGSSVVFSGMTAGLILNNVDIMEVSKIMSDGFGGLTSNIHEAIQQPTLKNWVHLALAGGSVGYGMAKFRSAADEAKECDLYKNIRTNTSEERQILVDHIDQLSVSSKHLLTHLTPEELQLFLTSKDQVQEDILRTRPPSFEQRSKSLLSSDSKMASKWRESLKLACATWDNEVEMFSHPVTFKESLLKIRREVQQSRPSIEVPTQKYNLITCFIALYNTGMNIPFRHQLAQKRLRDIYYRWLNSVAPSSKEGRLVAGNKTREGLSLGQELFDKFETNWNDLFEAWEDTPQKVWIWSDLHLFHKNICQYANRPFDNLLYMHEVMLNNAQQIPDDDFLIFGGDVSFGDLKDTRQWLDQISCRKLLVLGNHDIDRTYKRHDLEQLGFEAITDCLALPSSHSPLIWVSHYPLNHTDIPQDVLHVFGHIHDLTIDQPRMFNMCVEHSDYSPVPLKKLINGK